MKQPYKHILHSLKEHWENELTLTESDRGADTFKGGKWDTFFQVLCDVDWMQNQHNVPRLSLANTIIESFSSKTDMKITLENIHFIVMSNKTTICHLAIYPCYPDVNATIELLDELTDKGHTVDEIGYMKVHIFSLETAPDEIIELVRNMLTKYIR